MGLYDDLVREARNLYPQDWHVRSLCVEREWSPDGETELARYPYSRVRFVPVFDGLAALMRGEKIQTGIRAEIW